MKNRAEAKHMLLQEYLADKITEGAEPNARQAFLISKTDVNDTIMPLPVKCHRRAPDDINVYTDGSWVNTLKQYLGLGGAGVWWPKRSITRDEPGMHWLPVSIGEAMLAHHEQESEGLVLYTKIGG